MQAATHHEAVSALRNAGSCIKMKVLRERPLPREVCDPDGPQDPRDVSGLQPCSQDGGGQRSKQPKTESVEDCLSKKIEAVVCNGNGIVGSLLKSHKLFKCHHCFTMCLKQYVDYAFNINHSYTFLLSLSFCVSV